MTLGASPLLLAGAHAQSPPAGSLGITVYNGAVPVLLENGLLYLAGSVGGSLQITGWSSQPRRRARRPPKRMCSLGMFSCAWKTSSCSRQIWAASPPLCAVPDVVVHLELERNGRPERVTLRLKRML